MTKAKDTAMTVEKPKAKATKAVSAKKMAVVPVAITLQAGGKEYDIVAVGKAAEDAAREAVGKAALKSLSVYVKPEDGKAYFVANGDVDGSVDL